jgi:hypothetical protein
VKIKHNKTLIMEGTRSATTKLWQLQLPSTESPSMATYSCNAMGQLPHLSERIAFYHAALFSPSLSTWCDAIDNGHLTSWPELTSAQVRKHPPQSMAMHKGHMDQDRSNQRSTKQHIKQEPAYIPPKIEPDFISSSENEFHVPQIRSHFVYADCQQVTGQIYTDPTGRFIVPSTKGHQYMMVIYDYDSNFIHVEPMKNRTNNEMLSAFQRAITLFKSRCLQPQLQKLDNEASGLLQDFMAAENIDYQLVPPGIHRRNAAERAIHTFKNHFIAGLCTTDPKFPLVLWDQLLPQALITLNLL